MDSHGNPSVQFFSRGAKYVSTIGNSFLFCLFDVSEQIPEVGGLLVVSLFQVTHHVV